jgi:hypothetical protein
MHTEPPNKWQKNGLLLPPFIFNGKQNLGYMYMEEFKSGAFIKGSHFEILKYYKMFVEK